MAKYKIALMPGDGIGVDVMDAAKLVLDALSLDAEYEYADIGWKFWCEEGNPLPQRTIKTLRKSTCALFGAITSKNKEEAQKELKNGLQGQGLIYRSPILSLRELFDLYVSFRPCLAFAGNPLNYKDGLELIVFRENTEGLYSGLELFPLTDNLRAAINHHNPRMEIFQDTPGEDIALSLRVITVMGAQRIARAAFQYAARFGYPKVTLVEKANVLRETSGLMHREAIKVAADFPSVDLEITNIDAQVMWLVKAPENYGIMVTSNLFGDILSDLCAQLVGGLGFTPSGNIGDNFAIFEPSHGSAPKYSGQYVANPMAMILTVAMMLDWLKEGAMAKQVRRAVREMVAEGSHRTRDMGGESKTMDVAQEVARRLSVNY